MSVDTVVFDWILEQSQILDLFILQWHTPLLAGNSKIPSAIVIEKTAILKEFRDWLIRYFIVSETSSRPVFILAPELSLPFVCDSLICEIVTGMKRPVTFIAGLEYLQWSEYKGVLEHKSDMPQKQEWLKGNNVGAHVNAAGIWMSSDSKTVRRYIQPKREPSVQEGASIFCPDRYLLFVSKDQTSGRRLNFCVQICSDFSSDNKVDNFRQSLGTILTSELDITFLLQCNEDQEEGRFGSAVKRYFAAPTHTGMVKTSDGCLLFINNANHVLGKSNKFGKSAFHFEYTRGWKDPLVDPQPTYFARNNNANNYHELGLRESGPALYHLKYKPRYTLTISRGEGDELPFHCNRVCCAFIKKDSLINGKIDGDVFELLPPRKYWLSTEWDEGIRILEQDLKTDHIPVDIIEAIKEICYYCVKEWIGVLDEKLIEKLLGKYLILWKEEEGFPCKNPEPKAWLDSVSKSVNKFLETYALLAFGTQSLSPKNLQIDASLDYHALLDDINICFMWGKGERTVQGIISKFLSESINIRMVMGKKKILLIIVEPRSPIDKNSMALVIEKAVKQINEPEALPGEQHFVSGEVTSEKISVDLKGLCGAELEKNINTSTNRNEFEANLLEVVKGQIL